MAFDTYRQILDLVEEAVLGLPTTGSNVHNHPRSALDAAVMPALVIVPLVDTNAQVYEEQDQDADHALYQLEIGIQSYARTAAERDASTLEVRTAIMRVHKPGAARRHVRTEFPLAEEGERPLFVATQRFAIDYYVDAIAPGVIV